MGARITHRLTLIVSFLIIFSLLFGIPCTNAPSYADDQFPLSFDVWTNKGGEGPITPGGTFTVGEETIIYVRATVDVPGRWTISGPSHSDKGTTIMQGGHTYQMSLGNAETKDIGRWTITYEGEIYKNGVRYQGAMDRVIFDVVATSSVVAPSTASGTVALPTSTKIDEVNAMEHDALTALKMAEGSIPVDLNYDANRDGKVTDEDARHIMDWAVNGVGHGLPTADQQKIIDDFGTPAQFGVWYDFEDDTMMDFLVREEVWYYPDYGTCVTFIAGTIIDTSPYKPPEKEANYPKLMPWDFDGFMTYDQVMEKIGSKSADKLDLLLDGFDELGFAAYAAGPAVFIMEGDRLTYIQTIGTEKSGLLFGYDPQDEYSMNSMCSEIDTALDSINPLVPQPVKAGINLRQLGNWFAGIIKKCARILGLLPQKIARLFPQPFRGIVRTFLEYQLGNYKIFRLANKINDVAMLEKNRKEWSAACKKYAGKLDADVEKYKKEKNNLESKSLAELNMSESQRNRRIEFIDNLVPKLEDISDKLKKNAGKLTLGDLLRIGGKDLSKSVLKNIEKAITQMPGAEVERQIGSSKIRTLIDIASTDSRLAKAFNDFINGRIALTLIKMGEDPQLQSKIEKAVKDELRQGRANLRDIDSLIARAVAKLNKEGGQLMSEAEKLKKTDTQGGPKPPAETGDLSRYKTIGFNIALDNFVLSDKSTQSWGFKAEIPGKFTGNTFEGNKQFTDESGVNVTWRFKGTISEDHKKLTSFTMYALRITPPKDGIKGRRTEYQVDAENIDVRTATPDKIWCYTAAPDTSKHNTRIKYSTQYGTSAPDTFVRFSCKQVCWIEIAFLAK